GRGSGPCWAHSVAWLIQTPACLVFSLSIRGRVVAALLVCFVLLRLRFSVPFLRLLSGRRFRLYQFGVLVLQLLRDRRSCFLVADRLFLFVFTGANDIDFPTGQFCSEPDVLP